MITSPPDDDDEIVGGLPRGALFFATYDPETAGPDWEYSRSRDWWRNTKTGEVRVPQRVPRRVLGVIGEREDGTPVHGYKKH